MVIGCLLRDIARELRNLHITRKVLLEARVDHLALTRLQTVRDVRNRPLDIFGTKVGHITMDEIRDTQGLHGPVRNSWRRIGHVLSQPRLSIIRKRLGKGQVHRLIRFWIRIECDRELFNLLEIFFGLCTGRSSETLVVFDRTARGLCRPELLLREEPDLSSLDNRSDHRNHKTHLDKLWPIDVKHIKDQTLDVAPIQIRIGHNHQAAVSEVLQ